MRKVVKSENSFETKPHSHSPTVLRELQKQIFQNKKIREQQNLIEIVSKETRLQILMLLKLKNFVCVGDIADVLRLDISAVSHQLGILRVARLVVPKRKGRVIYYSLAENLPGLIKSVIS